MIPDGSIVQYNGVWTTGFLASFSAAGIVSRIGEDLTGAGIVVRNATYDSTPLGGVPFGGLKVHLDLQVENGLGFGKPEDIISLVRHFVYQETGDYPVSDSIPAVKFPGGTSVPTGQPGATGNAPSGCISGTNTDQDGNFSLSCWFENLTHKSLTTLGLVFIGVLFAIALIVVGKKAT